MTYDIFLSYAAEDVAWAAKLETDLKADGTKVFRDGSRLEVGRKWEPQLQQALDQSQHLVNLWSNNAKNSNWVHKELSRFERQAEDDSKRRLICVNLEGRNDAYQSYQHIDIDYAADPAGLDADVWRSLVTRIRAAIEEDENVERIETVVLAMTADDADTSKGGGLSRASLTTIQEQFGLSESDVRARYTGGPLDWHPFGGPVSVRSLLDQLIVAVNGAVGTASPDLHFGWRPVADEFWLPLESANGARDVATRLARSKLSLIVVDTLSLQAQSIYRRLMLLRDYLKNTNSTWIFVPPMQSDPQIIRYRQLVQSWSAPLLDAYFNPPVGKRDAPLPQLGVYCGDDGEMRRLVLSAVGDYLSTSERPARSPYTDYRGR